MAPKKKPPELERAEQLVDFLQAVALGEREATEDEVAKATEELGKLLPDRNLN